jgi:PAS domain S-box-containing protein
MIQKERLWQSVIKSGEIGICVIDVRNKIVEVNDTFCDIYGYRTHELLQRPYSILEPGHYRERALLQYLNFVKSKRNKGFRKIMTRSGEKKTVYCSSSMISDEKEQPLKLLSIIDMSTEKLQEQVSGESGQVGLNLKTGLVRCDHEGKLLFANPFARTLLFMPAGCQHLKGEVSTFSGNLHRRVSLLSYINDKRSIEQQEVLLHRDNEADTWVLLSSATAMDGNDGKLCFDLSLSPLQEQKNLENKLTQRVEELQAANQRLDHFVYGATHDIKAPLASLAGLLDILRREKDTQQKEVFMQMMEKSIHRLNDFIREVVDYSRNANQSIKREAVHFQEIVEEVFESMQHMENAGRIRSIINVEQSLPFYSDVRRIKVVLNNLVSNAYRYSSTHRRDGFIEVKVQVERSSATIMVRDNGQGIAKPYQEKIFDMFFRASEGQSGTGLGLYIVKETLDKMGGRIHLVSELGKGTCFVVNIPMVNEPEGGQMELDI